MKKLIIFEIFLIIFFVLAWNVSKAEEVPLYCEMYSKDEYIGIMGKTKPVEISYGEKYQVYKLKLDEGILVGPDITYRMTNVISEEAYYLFAMTGSAQIDEYYNVVIDRYSLYMGISYTKEEYNKETKLKEVTQTLSKKFNCKIEDPKI